MALYLGKDKIAGIFSETIVDSKIGDTLPVGAIIDYDGTEVPANWELFEGEAIAGGLPKIQEEILYLDEIEDGLYDCSYQFYYGSRTDEQNSMGGGVLITGYEHCILYKHTPNTSYGGIINPDFVIGGGPQIQPFVVRLIRPEGDIMITVNSAGIIESKKYISAEDFETLRDDVIGMSTTVGNLQRNAYTPVGKMVLVDVLNGNFLSRQDMTITPGMTWQDVIDDTDFLNFDNAFDAPEGEVQWNYYLLYYDSNGYVTVKSDDKIRDGWIYYSIRNVNFQN